MRITSFLIACAVFLIAGILGTLAMCWLTRPVPPAGLSEREVAAFPELVALVSGRTSPDEVGVFWAHGELFADGVWDADCSLDKLGYIENDALTALKQRLPNLTSPKTVLRNGPEVVRFLVFENWYSDERVLIVWGKLELHGGGGWGRSIYVNEKGKWRLEASLGGRSINMWK